MKKFSAFGSATRRFASLAVLALAVPAHADVKSGVDAWSRGDYAKAIAEWEGPAAAGDPDALFNMGQAYRLGLGVAENKATAEQYYARAAGAGHVRAADIYGLMLFQSGRTTQAMPYIEEAAERGDPRSQYLLGVAHFNGDIVPKDWVRAYALVLQANDQRLPQAAEALSQMEEYIPADQRQRGRSLAQQMQQHAAGLREAELAGFDLAAIGGEASAPVPAPAAPPGGRVPQAIPQVDIPPSLAEAQDAVRQAREATGTEDPRLAGADYARPTVAAAAAPASPAPKPQATPAPKPPAPKPAAVAQAPAQGGAWKLQLGAFGVSGNAEKLWAQLSKRPELAGKSRQIVPGKLSRLLATGFASRAEAAAACDKLKANGHNCIVTQ